MNATAMIIISLLSTVFTIAEIVAMWKVFQKADMPGWWSIVPIWSLIAFMKLVGLHPALLLLMFTGIGSPILMFLMYFKLGVAFNCTTPQCVLSVLFSPVILLVLAFHPDYQYAL